MSDEPATRGDSPAGGDGADDGSTVCPLCAVGCRLAPAGGEGRSRPADGRAEGRAGPANPDGRLCRKGVFAFEGIEERLTAPRVREGEELVEASWTEAYGRIVDGIETAVAREGADGVAFLGAPHSTTEENYLLGRLARTLGTNNVDNRARHCHASTTRALETRFGWPATTNSLEDLPTADVILVVGANPAMRQPVAFNSTVRPAVADGTTLVHVEPVGNETTRLADVHLPPRPGTDALVLDLLCSRVLAAGNADRAFVTDRTSGFEAFVEATRAVEASAGADAADVPPEALDRVAALVGEADRVAAVVGTGIEKSDGAADALLNLLLLTGNVGRPGTGVHVFRGPPNEQGATDAGCVPDRLPGHQSIDDPDARSRVAAAWDVEPPTSPGISAMDALDHFGEDIRAALVVGENPAVSKRDPDWVDRRLDALDCLAVVELTESETTDRADVVLPAAAGLEKAGTVTNLDRQIQRLRPVVDPPEGVRTDRRILCDLAGRLDPVGAAFAFDDPGEVFAELSDVAPVYGGVDYDRLGTGGARWPVDADPALYGASFATPDGRAPFVPPEVPATGDDAREGFRLVVRGRAGEAGGTEPDADQVRLHPLDADARGLVAGDPVLVADDERAVEGVADVDGSVRRATVGLHAAVADRFVRAGTTHVSVDPAGDGDS